MTKLQGRLRVNEQIRAREVRVIDASGQRAGIMPLADALRLAESQDLDLVEVAPMATPPVCRIMDFGKFRYQQKKRAQESRRKQSFVQVKEVKVGSRTDEHDIDFKIGHIKKFLEQGHRVKVSVFFRGREITHPDLGREMLARVYTKLEGAATVEGEPRLDGRNMSMILVPK